MSNLPNLARMENNARMNGKCIYEFEGHTVMCESHDGVEVLWRWDDEVVSYGKVLERLRAE